MTGESAQIKESVVNLWNPIAKDAVMITNHDSFIKGFKIHGG